MDSPIFGLERDLLARVRKIEIPPLKQRAVDIPSIFDQVLREALERVDLEPEPIMDLLSTSHYHSLMLDGFDRENVRGLIDLADRITTRIAKGTAPRKAITDIFSEQFGAKYPSTKAPQSACSADTTQETVAPYHSML